MPVAYEWLMPLAPWEPPSRLHGAVESLCRQTWPAERLVVSVDGLLPSALAEVLQAADLPVLILEASAWQGTGPTLAAGLSACRCQWVLRADADDRSEPQRAERQLRYLQQHPYLTALGGQLTEIHEAKPKVTLRRVPETPQQVQDMIGWRNPINHPTVALKREAVLRAGNYRSVLSFEDWDLWLRLSRQGAVLANLPEALVTAQVGEAHLGRRHGSAYAKREARFLLRCGREGLVPLWRVAVLILLRLPWRLLPACGLASLMGVLRSKPWIGTNPQRQR